MRSYVSLCFSDILVVVANSLFYRQVLVLPGESLMPLDLGIHNQHSSSRWIPFLCGLFPWGMERTWLQYSFYKFSSEMFLFTSFAHLFIWLWNLLGKQCFQGAIGNECQKPCRGNSNVFKNFLPCYLIYVTFVIRNLFVTYVIRLFVTALEKWILIRVYYKWWKFDQTVIL